MSLKKPLSIMAIAGTAIATLLVLLGDRNSEQRLATAPEYERVWSDPEINNALSKTVNNASADGVSEDFRLDIGRLYDLSYETDPALMDFASSINKSPACVVDIAKRVVENDPTVNVRCENNKVAGNSSKVLLPGDYESVCRYIDSHEYCRKVKVADHPYEEYSDEELLSLVTSSPEAAVILARRVVDASESRIFYEHAVALSGRPGPLEEWMLHRNTGGLIRMNGELDVERAIVGYEIYLTTARLNYGSDALREYERILIEQGIDLEPIKQRAAVTYEELTDLRKTLVGMNWEDRSS